MENHNKRLSPAFELNGTHITNNNENVWSRGADHLKRSSPAPCNTFFRNGNIPDEASGTSPWDMPRYGSTNISPSGTVSPASSTHSYDYGQSPDTSMESVIMGILRAVELLGSNPSGEPRIPEVLKEPIGHSPQPSSLLGNYPGQPQAGQIDDHRCLRRRTPLPPIGSRPIGSRPVGMDPIGTRPIGMEPIGTRPIGMEPIGSRPIGMEPIGSRPIGMEPIGSRPIGMETIGSRPIAHEPIGSRLSAQEPIGSRLSPSVHLNPAPKGRPIPGNLFPVVVRSSRDLLKPMSQTILTIGDNGAPEDNLCRPWGVTCDREGHVIIADRSNNRIQIFREDGSFVRRFGTHGTGPGQFDRPAGVAVDERRRIIVADKDNHRIQVLTMDGRPILAFGEKGSRTGQFNYPWDVATNSMCQIVVSDTRNHRIQLFSPEGIFLRKYGYENVSCMLKFFDSPRGVAFNPEGDVVVTDFNNHQLLIISADFMSAKQLIFDSDSPDLALKTSFLRPQGLVVDDNGNIIVADSKNHRIQVLDSSGTLKWTFGTLGTGIGEMDRPSGIALTVSGRIAVVDFGNNRVKII